MRLVEWAVYGFLAWFESFNSVWQTTVAIFGVWGIEALFPGVDPGHLTFLLVLSLYATWTQNGLAHENKLTSDKLDQALSQIDTVVDQVLVGTESTLTIAKHEQDMQDALIAQSETVVAAVGELRKALAQIPTSPRRTK